MISSYVGENAEFERQYLSGELELELTPQVISLILIIFTPPHGKTNNLGRKQRRRSASQLQASQ